MNMLTKAQGDMLASHAGFRIRNVGVMHRTAIALETQGLVIWKPGHWFGGWWEITPAGRAALTDGAGE